MYMYLYIKYASNTYRCIHTYLYIYICKYNIYTHICNYTHSTCELKNLSTSERKNLASVCVRRWQTFCSLNRHSAL